MTAQREWAENWNGDVSGDHAANEEAVTSFGVEGSAGTMTLPNGVIYKEFYGTGWQAGLTTQSEVWSAGVRKKWTTATWTQDNTGVSYLLNPRLTETNVRDDLNNFRRTTIHYGPYEQYSLPHLVREYTGLDGNTPIRDTYTDYKLSQAYLDRRIIGLVSAVHVSNTAQWQTKTTYEYDEPTKIESLPATATRHDASYNTSLLTRGNVTSVSRWDVEDISNPVKALTTQISYNTAGSVIRSTDPSNHSNNIFYNDSFSDGLNSRNTFAYPTFATDADGFLSYAQYNFDFGALTLTQGPPPAGQSQGAIKTMYYDAAGRLQWLINVNNSAWKYFAYAERGDAVMTQETINAAPPSYWSITVVDGANRVRLVGGDHPGSLSGPYAGAFTSYDVMGRVSQQSNPAETTAGWAPTRDDEIAGWVYTSQTYDWQGRPLVTTYPSITGNPNETTTKEISYGGCGCAGGAVVILTDEGTSSGGPKRKQKIYSDVLGRTVKTEVMNWDGVSVYSATVNSYNARNQITQVRQYAGAEGSGTYQDTTTTYDGYGRLKTKHSPEQSPGLNTVWDYNTDDTVQKITDARGASQTFGYNGRHLVTSKTYSASGGISVPGAVTFAYDDAGNRTSMTDGFGSAAYNPDELSRITSESRTFTGVGTFTINYSYNLAGSLTSITDPFGAQVGYTRDAADQITAVTGSGFAGVTSYMSNILYRAWGDVKSASYGDGSSHTTAYNFRMLPTEFRLTHSVYGNLLRENYSYYQDGRLSNVQDLDDTVGSNPPSTLRFLSRGFGYDHMGRVTGSSGTGAGSGGKLPYTQGYQYDAFNNMTSRVGSYYDYPGTAGASDSATYVNNRRNGWTHDDDGRFKSNPATSTDDAHTVNYDAAGRMIQNNASGAFSNINYSAGYDGLDQLVFEQTSFNPNGPPISYSVRSTVLGGNVLTTVNQSGQKLVTHVAAPTVLFATQRTYSSGNQVLFTKRNPTGNSEQGQVVYDPLGNYIPFRQFVDPRPGPGSYSSMSLSGVGGVMGNPDGYGLGCLLDGIAIGDCNKVLSRNNGNASLLVIDARGQNPNVTMANLGLFLVQHPISPGSPTKPKLKPRRPGNRNPFGAGRDEVDWGFSLVRYNHAPQKSGNEFSREELEQFKSCLSMFKVYYEDHKFVDGGEAYFKGRSDSMSSWYKPWAIGNFTIRTDQQSYSTAALHYKMYGVLGGSSHVIRGFTDTSSPYVNAIANDAVLKGREALGIWVHELGNSLSLITNIAPPIAKDAADRYDEDTDAGTAFEDCVFGGHVTPNGILRPRP